MGSPQCIFGRRRLDQRIFPVNIAAPGEMGMQIDEAGKQSRVPEIDLPRARRHGQRRAHRHDPIALDSNHGRRQWFPTAAVDEPRRANDDDAGLRGSRDRLGRGGDHR